EAAAAPDAALGVADRRRRRAGGDARGPAGADAGAPLRLALAGHHAIAPRVLRRVQRGIGGADQLTGVAFASRHALRHADADRGHADLLDRVAQSFRQLARALGVDVRDQHRELLSAVARDQI